MHKRIWQVHLWCGKCCWSDARREYYSGKQEAYKSAFHVTPAQKDDLVQWLRTSVHFLAERSLMDYSLMVSCQTMSVTDPSTALVIEAIEEQRAASKHGAGHNPLPFISLVAGELQVLQVGVIDFLQDWTCAKNIAMAIKVCERNKATVPPDEYGARFIRVREQT